MRKLMWLIGAALLVGGAACKKSETEKNATEVRKAADKVDQENKDVQKQLDDVSKEQKDVAKETAELTDAEARLKQARVDLTTSVKTRLATIDSKLAILESRTDPVSKKLAMDLRVRRDMVFDRSTVADSIAIGSWDQFKKEIEGQLNVLDNDLHKAVDKAADAPPPPPPVSQ